MVDQHHMSFESTHVASHRGLVGSTGTRQSGALKILLLAHDLSDAAIERRIAMLRVAAAQVTVAGFRRTSQPVENVAGCRTVDFGQTFNAGFLQRIGAVLQTVIGLHRYEALFADADLIIARNLEMLAIGARGRTLCKPLPVLVYECLDIHRLILNKGPVGMVLRWLERRLSRRAAAILTSSPAFITHYFQRTTRQLKKMPIRLVENKVLLIKEETLPSDTKMPPRTPGPPWVIGWFGMIRCTRSLRLLTELAQQSEGKVEVIIRGKPLKHLFGDFEKRIRGFPG
jgi:succinoglycan biosynthesis protein ExoL